MLDAIAAERLKFARHRATWGLVWIWPIGVALLWTIMIVVTLVWGDGNTPDAAEAMARLPQPDADAWAASRAAFWHVPPHTVGRYLVGSFVAVVFAGEYGWNTWKLIVPHRSRASLIAAKYVIAVLLLFAGFVAAALVFGVLDWLRLAAVGAPMPADLTFGALARAQGIGLLSAIAPVLLTTAYVSLFAVLTRSTVGALLIGLVLTTVEAFFVGLAPLLSAVAPVLTKAVLTVMPGYHLGNIGSWIASGEPRVLTLMTEGFSMSPGVSVGIMAGWVVVLVGLTFQRFGRQDIN